MGRKRVIHKKRQKPTLKIDPASYERLKAEAELLNRGHGKIKLGELLSFILDTYFENKDAFSELTGGAIGTQPEFETEERDERPRKENGTKQDSLFNTAPVKQAENRLLTLKGRRESPPSRITNLC